jgi:hypothetical protein
MVDIGLFNFEVTYQYTYTHNFKNFFGGKKYNCLVNFVLDILNFYLPFFFLEFSSTEIFHEDIVMLNFVECGALLRDHKRRVPLSFQKFLGCFQVHKTNWSFVLVWRRYKHVMEIIVVMPSLNGHHLMRYMAH